MSDEATPAKAPDNTSDGSAIWALIVGGAILAIAALLIFSQGGDTAAQRGGPGGKTAAGQQANLSADGTPAGQGLGVGRREIDPAEARPTGTRITPGILPLGQAGTTMAPPRPPAPEPTSFPDLDTEIAYYQKKLEEARVTLEQRTLFRERSQKAIDEAPTQQARETAEQRNKVVEDNYQAAKKKHEELVKKVDELKKKRQSGGS